MSFVTENQPDGTPTWIDLGVPDLERAMAFYGAIEQVLTGWIFGLIEEGEDSYERAKDHVVETVCRGLETYTPAP